MFLSPDRTLASAALPGGVGRRKDEESGFVFLQRSEGNKYSATIRDDEASCI